MLDFTGRSREVGRLRALLDSKTGSVTLVSGIRGGGKSRLIRRVLGDHRGLMYTCPPLPDAGVRAGLVAHIEQAPDAPPVEGRPPDHSGASWTGIFEWVSAHGRHTDRPFVLVLDDAHRLSEARSRFTSPLVEMLSRRNREGLAPIHVVLAGQPQGLPDPADLEPCFAETIDIGPLPLRSAVPLLPGSNAEERLLAYGVFGGIPRVLERLDRDVTTGTNVRRLVLNPEGALADAAADWLERDVQTPARYFAIMSALSAGEADWATVHAGVPDLTRSGQVAPYLARLSDLGLVTARRSLDAAPTSRSTRYALADPFLTFWFRFVPPLRFAPGIEAESASYGRAVRPSLDDHLSSVFPEICRQHMRHDAIGTLGANAREEGSLWGPGYDVPVAGLLTTGAAYYGSTSWTPDERADTPVARIEHAMKETRYGFGRERRIRLVFAGRAAPLWLRRDVIRRQDAALIDAEALVGEP